MPERIPQSALFKLPDGSNPAARIAVGSLRYCITQLPDPDPIWHNPGWWAVFDFYGPVYFRRTVQEALRSIHLNESIRIKVIDTDIRSALHA